MLEIADEDAFLIKRSRAKSLGLPSRFITSLDMDFWNVFITAPCRPSSCSRGVRAELEKRITVRYKGTVVGEYDADLLVEDVVLVEIKIATQYDKRDEAQLLNELKATGLMLGLLINFGRSKVEFHRFTF